MTEWFASHDGIEQMFLLCALLGGTILILRLILTIAGIDGHDGDVDTVHASSEHGFQILTIHGISSFFAMFGVVGYSLYHNTSIGMLLALAGAVIAGVAAVWIIQRIFMGMLHLQSSGTVSLDEAVGSEGSVYLTVSKDGGRVQINVANRLREFEAVSADGATIPTGTAIRVQRVAANTLVVAPIR
ncbi:MAG TPA: NfeD family protein [Steroidobacteraceae bacterium]|nr:NfeD family protein [Steroidobacteraceae bacterium]